MSDGAKSTQWQEIVPADEAALIAGYVQAIERYQAGFARRGDGRPRRGFHVKSHIGLPAEFRVLADIPPEPKHGVFRAPRSYAASVRLTNGFSDARADWFPDLLGWAVKLHGVDGPKLMDGEADADTQDFLALNHPYIPAADAGEMLVMSTSAANVLTAPAVLLRGLGVAQTLRVALWTLGWMPHRLLLRSAVTEDFYGETPIAIGPHAVKFRWRSCQSRVAPATGLLARNRLRDDLRARLAAGDVRYDFLVQFYADPARTPIDGAYRWKPEDAPYVKLAELTIAQRDIDCPEARREESRLETMAYNPWHAIAEHRPLGNIQRARRLIYAASARQRGRVPDPAA